MRHQTEIVFPCITKSVGPSVIFGHQKMRRLSFISLHHIEKSADSSSAMRKMKNAFFAFLVISLLIHSLGYIGLVFSPLRSPKDALTQIELVIEDSESKEDLATALLEESEKGQIVEQDSEPLNSERDERSEFLSRHNQTVKKQTLAKNRGQFQNLPSTGGSGAGSGASSPLDRFKPQFDLQNKIREQIQADSEKEKELEAAALKEFQESRKSKDQSAQRGSGGSPENSQTIDYIKDIDPGLQTLLSTKEFVYYSYFARIREQLNQHWGPKVKEKITTIYRQGRSIASTDDKITRCLVTLDKNGKLIKVQIIGDSGVRELDEAAIEAFRAAAPFPNPPRGIIDEDGMIKIRWDFILEA